MKVQFCPYIASMWRSMAPLYREHAEVGDEVQTMPLPYWVRNSNGELATKKDEGLRFPAGINIVHHSDLEQIIAPDRIYFHNPYDDQNSITCVDPAYFSNKLKERTKELVYVPYYTIGPGDVDGPAIHNADKVVCWTDQQAENFSQMVGADKVIRKDYPEPEQREIPERWREIINGRRVILFNNSLCSLMQNPAREISKIETWFRQYAGKNVCMLWRPHPLFMDTIKALYPRLEVKYFKVMQNYGGYGWIYDESWDVDRAIQAADEYLGDPSSVVDIFKLTGKPVTII